MSKINYETTIIDNVIRLRIDIPFDVKFVCVYLFELGGKRVLIDAGLHILPWKKIFLQELKKLKIHIRDIDYCIVSHEHLDHCGLLKFFKRKNPEMKILMHKFTEESLRLTSDPDNFKTMKENAKEFSKDFIQYGMEPKYVKRVIQYFLLWPQLIRYVEPDLIIDEDSAVPIDSKSLECIWTPGHSIGHICVFNPESSHLFSGDHILSRITPHIGIYHQLSLVEPEHFYPNILEKYLASLDKIELLSPNTIFPAHQEIIYNPLERIKEIKAHHQNRFKEIKNIIKDKPKTPYKISQLHFGTDLDDMNKYLAMNEVLGHLIYLENHGEVKRTKKDNKILFSS
ncbi:MAG: MBL fold metallo-hydrolase [Promethearchaeota archaeon]|nr:MAG: MBL fold metallo-hydrolase [Candidatus Lokiarchaeota archaeon]